MEVEQILQCKFSFRVVKDWRQVSFSFKIWQPQLHLTNSRVVQRKVITVIVTIIIIIIIIIILTVNVFTFGYQFNINFDFSAIQILYIRN